MSTDVASREQQWAEMVAHQPRLIEKFGEAPPAQWDRALNLYQYMNDRAGDDSGASSFLGGKAYAGQAAVTPDPVDWGQRWYDLTGIIPTFHPMLNIVGKGIDLIPGQDDPFEQWYPEELPEDASLLRRWFRASQLEGMLNAFAGEHGWTDVIRPGQAALNALFEPGVRERYGQLRDQNIGPFSAMQAAYEQAQEAGEVPWWQDIATGVVTDPLELVPGVGMYAGATRLAARGAARALRPTLSAAQSARLASDEIIKQPTLGFGRRTPYGRDPLPEDPSYFRTLDLPEPDPRVTEDMFGDLDVYRESLDMGPLQAGDPMIQRAPDITPVTQVEGQLPFPSTIYDTVPGAKSKAIRTPDQIEASRQRRKPWIDRFNELITDPDIRLDLEQFVKIRGGDAKIKAARAAQKLRIAIHAFGLGPKTIVPDLIQTAVEKLQLSKQARSQGIVPKGDRVTMPTTKKYAIAKINSGSIGAGRAILKHLENSSDGKINTAEASAKLDEIVTAKEQAAAATLDESIIQPEVVEKSIASLKSIVNADNPKATVIKNLQKELGRDADGAFTEEVIDNFDQLDEAIDAYKEVEKAGLTPQEYIDEKQDFFDEIVDLIEDFKPTQEIYDAVPDVLSNEIELWDEFVQLVGALDAPAGAEVTAGGVSGLSRATRTEAGWVTRAEVEKTRKEGLFSHGTDAQEKKARAEALKQVELYQKYAREGELQEYFDDILITETDAKSLIRQGFIEGVDFTKDKKTNEVILLLTGSRWTAYAGKQADWLEEQFIRYEKPTDPFDLQAYRDYANKKGLDPNANSFWVEIDDKAKLSDEIGTAGNRIYGDTAAHKARHIRENATPYGQVVENLINSGYTVSDWLDKARGGLDPTVLIAKIDDQLQRGIKEILTPSQMRSLEGVSRTIKGKIPFLPAETQVAVFRRAVERLFGTTRQSDRHLKYIHDRGTKEMRDDLGWFDKAENLRPEKWGTTENPGQVMLLFKALHNPALHLEDYKRSFATPDQLDKGMKHYANLRSITGWESVLRGWDPDATLADGTTYFFRGFRMTKRVDAADAKSVLRETGQLGKDPVFEMKRSQVLIDGETKQITFDALLDMGFEPIFLNPYSQAVLSTRLGTQYRLQTEMLEILKDQSVGQAKIIDVANGMPLDPIPEGWRTLKRGIGPALKGVRFNAVPKKAEALVEDDALKADAFGGQLGADGRNHSVEAGKEWIFPNEIANTIEEMFAPKEGIWQSLRTERTIPKLGVNIKLDDLVYMPKRAKLLFSLFQQIDFANRAGVSGFHAVLWQMYQGMRMLGQGQVDDGFKEILTGAFNIRRIPDVWWKMAKANVSPKYREELNKVMRSNEPLFPDNPALKDITWNNIFNNGLHVSDETIYGPDEGVGLLHEVADASPNLINKTSESFRMLEKHMREGLFNGVYPAAILHDVQYNILPMVVKAHPDLNSSQIMGLTAELANIKWSTIPTEMSVFKGNLRQVLLRSLFSLQELESVARQTTGAISGPNATFWRGYWAGAIVFWAAVGNAIHFTTTSLTKSEDGSLKPDFKMGELLPADRYIPFDKIGWNILDWGYRQSFVSPDVPIPTRDGNRATMDLIQQLDLTFRLLDGGSGFPMWSFFSSRMGTMPRSTLGFVTGEDYFGRDTDEWGYGQKALQFIYDSFAPIGAGQLAVAAAQERMKDTKLGGIPGILKPGATVGQVGPSTESRLGLMGIAIQGMGFNLKTMTNEAIRDKMVSNTLGSGENDYGKFNTWGAVQNRKDKRIINRLVYADPKNTRLVEELNARAEEGSLTYYNNVGKFHEERRLVYADRLKSLSRLANEQQAIINSDEAWDPGVFKKELSSIKVKTEGKLMGISDIYGDDPGVKEYLNREEPDRNVDPVGFVQHRYYSLRSKLSDESVSGKVNHDKFRTLWEQETQTWSDDPEEIEALLALFEADRTSLTETMPNSIALVRGYYEAVAQLSKAGYWNDTPRGEMDYLKERIPNAEEMWRAYRSATPAERDRVRMSGNREIRFIVSTMERARRQHKYRVIMENPELDKILIRWWRTNPYHRENVEYYYELYKRVPSSLRQVPR